MTDQSPAQRIEAAIRRIDAAVARRERAMQDLTRRHDTLRAHVADAIAALDAMERADG